MRCLLGLHTALWCMLLLRNRAQGLLTASQYLSIVIRFASLSTLKRPLPVVKPLSLMENDQLLALGKLYEFQVASRPSKTIKSPYVADLVSCAEPGVTKLAHSPSLDCAGMIVEGSTVLCSRNDATKGSKTEYAIQLCYDKRDESSAIVGCHPSLAETIAKVILEKRCLKGVEFDSFRGQETIGDSRVDFVLSSNDSNIRTLVEVKNVVCADYAPSEVADTLSPTKRKKMKLPARYVGIEDDANLGSYKRAAIFPHGSKHKDLKVVSPRAIKHICGLIRLSSKAAPVSDASSTELEASEKSRKRKKKLDSSSNKKLKVEPKLDDRYAAVLLFIVNRSDAEIFRPCHEADMLFAQLVKKAIDVGVKVIAQEVRWELTPSDEKNAYEVVAKLGRLLPVQVSATVDANSIDEDHLDQIIKSFSE